MRIKVLMEAIVETGKEGNIWEKEMAELSIRPPQGMTIVQVTKVHYELYQSSASKVNEDE